MTTYLAMLPFAALQSLMAWSVRFVPTPIKTQLMRSITGLGFAAALFGSEVAEIAFYRYLSGIQGGLEHDNVFIAVLVGGNIVALFFIFSSARARQAAEKEKARELTK